MLSRIRLIEQIYFLLYTKHSVKVSSMENQVLSIRIEIKNIFPGKINQFTITTKGIVGCS